MKNPAHLAVVIIAALVCLPALSQAAPGDRAPKPRLIDNGDGTVTDKRTGLQWAKTVDDGSVRDKDNTYTWSASGPAPDGSAFVEYLGTLNSCVEAGGFPPADLTGGFAGHCDWRLPSVVEIQTIFDTNAADCGDGEACINPIFGPTINYNYWTSTTFAEAPSFAWFADFDVAQVEDGAKTGAFHVRAVRSVRPRRYDQPRAR